MYNYRIKFLDRYNAIVAEEIINMESLRLAAIYADSIKQSLPDCKRVIIKRVK